VFLIQFQVNNRDYSTKNNLNVTDLTSNVSYDKRSLENATVCYLMQAANPLMAPHCVESDSSEEMNFSSISINRIYSAL